MVGPINFKTGGTFHLENATWILLRSGCTFLIGKWCSLKKYRSTELTNRILIHSRYVKLPGFDELVVLCFYRMCTCMTMRRETIRIRLLYRSWCAGKRRNLSVSRKHVREGRHGPDMHGQIDASLYTVLRSGGLLDLGAYWLVATSYR